MNSPLMNGVGTIAEWLWRFLYVNILWLLFLFPGLVVFGLFPSTAAMFTVVRNWVTGDIHEPIFRVFWRAYKKYFVEANLLFLSFMLAGCILYLDYRFLQAEDGTIAQLLYFPFFTVIFLFSLMAMYIFPVFVHYDLKTRQVIKNSFLVMIVSPISTLTMLVVIVAFYFTISHLLVLFPIIGVSVFAYFTMWSAYRAFQKVEQKKNIVNEQQK